MRSALLVGVFRGFDFLLSFLISILLAGRFGAGGQIDAFFIARRATIGLGDTIHNLVSTVVMPAVVARQARGSPISARNLPRRAWLFGGGLLLLTLLGTLFPGTIVAVFAPGFDAPRHALAARVMQILMPLLPIAVIGSLLMAVLQANRRFLGAEMNKLVQRGLLVLVLALAIPPLGILSAAWTMLIAGVLGLGLLLAMSWTIIRSHPEELLRPKPKAAEHEQVAGGGMLAAMLLHAYYLGSNVIDFAVASTLDAGSVAALEYGSRLVSLLPGLVTASVYVVIYPEVVRALRDPDSRRAGARIAGYQRLAFLVQLPVAIGLMVAARPIVDLIFGHGVFAQSSIDATAAVTVGYAAAAMFLMPLHVTTTAIYADTQRSSLRAMALIALAGLALRAGLVVVLARVWGEAGIAWAAAVATVGSLMLAMTIAARRLPHMDMAAQARDFARIGLCGTIAAAVGYAVLRLMGEGGMLWDLCTIGLIGLATLGAYVGTASALRIPEVDGARRLIESRLVRWRESRS